MLVNGKGSNEKGGGRGGIEKELHDIFRQTDKNTFVMLDDFIHK